MTACPRIALPLFSHGCLIALVLSLGTLWETDLGGVLLSPSMILVCREQDCPRQRLLAIRTFFVRLQTFLPPRHGSLGLIWNEPGLPDSLAPHYISWINFHVLLDINLYNSFLHYNFQEWSSNFLMLQVIPQQESSICFYRNCMEHAIKICLDIIIINLVNGCS